MWYFLRPSHPPPCFGLFAPLIFAQYCCQCATLLLLGLWNCEQLLCRPVYFSGCGHVRPLQPPENVFLFLVYPLSSVGVKSAREFLIKLFYSNLINGRRVHQDLKVWPVLTVYHVSVVHYFFYVMGDLSIALSFA